MRSYYFPPPEHTDSLPTKIFPFGHSFCIYFVSYVFCCYCGSASLWRCISHCSPAVLSVLLSGLSAPEFSIISAHLGLSLELPFFPLPFLIEDDRRIAAIMSADRVLLRGFGSQWYRVGTSDVGQQCEGRVWF